MIDIGENLFNIGMVLAITLPLYALLGFVVWRITRDDNE